MASAAKRFTWGLHDLPSDNANQAAYPKWVISPEDPLNKRNIETRYNTFILTPYEIAECLKIIDISNISEKTGVMYLSCITSSGHHSSTIMPSRSFTDSKQPPHVKAFFIIRGPNPEIQPHHRWCRELNRISNSEGVVQLAYAELMKTIFDVFYSSDGHFGPLDWEEIVKIFNDAMTHGRKNFSQDIKPYIEQARLLLQTKSTPENMKSYVNLVQLIVELLRNDGFQLVQPNTYNVGSLTIVHFDTDDDNYVRTDGQETSEDIKKAAFNLIIMIEVHDGTHKYKIRMDIDREKLSRKLPQDKHRISYWVGQFIEFTNTRQFIEIVIGLLRNDPEAKAPEAKAAKAKAAKTKYNDAAAALQKVLSSSLLSSASASASASPPIDHTRCINTAITSGCKGGEFFFYKPPPEAPVDLVHWLPEMLGIVRPSFSYSYGDLVFGFYHNKSMKEDQNYHKCTSTRYTGHFILCNPFTIPGYSFTCADKVHYYCILPAAAAPPPPYFFLTYDYTLVDSCIGTTKCDSAGAAVESCISSLNTQNRQTPLSILEEATLMLSQYQAQEDEAAEKAKAKAEAMPVDEKEDEKEEDQEEEMMQVDQEKNASVSKPNSIFGSIINSFCSFFRSARVSFDIDINIGTKRTNVLICGGINFKKMMIMFVLEAAERYECYANNGFDGFSADDDDLVFVTNLASDAAYQLNFLLPDRKLFASRLAPRLLAPRLASQALTHASVIARESDAINKLPYIQNRKIVLRTCANVAIMVARIVAYCCALIITDKSVMNPLFLEYIDDFYRKYLPHNNFVDNENFYSNELDDINYFKQTVNDDTMTLLDSNSPLFTTAISEVEAIVARYNREAEEKQHVAVTQLLTREPIKSAAAAEAAEQLVSNAGERLRFTFEDSKAISTFYDLPPPLPMTAGSSRRKSRKNAKKNTRRNKKFHMSSKTKKQRRRGYSVRLVTGGGSASGDACFSLSRSRSVKKKTRRPCRKYYSIKNMKKKRVCQSKRKMISRRRSHKRKN